MSGPRFHRRALFGLGAGLGAALAAPAQAKSCEGGRSSWIPSEELQQDLSRLMSIAGVPGISVAAVDEGRVWAQSWGVKNILTGDPVTDDTLFETASMTKPVFAYVAMRLVDEGLLALDTPLVHYRRPDYLGDDPNLALITVRDVLRHGSGLPNWADKPLVTVAKPGARYTYSGEGLIWLQLVIEQLTGKSLEEVARDRLFRPAGMKRSTFGWDAAIARDTVYGHSGPDEDQGTLPAQPTRALGEKLLAVAARWRKPIGSWRYEEIIAATREADPGTPPSTNYLMINAAGGLLASAADYARFMLLMMDGRERASWQISEASRREMLTPQLEVRGKHLSRGLGWELEQSPGVRLFGHGGNNFGIFRTLGLGDAEKGRAIIVFTNGAKGNLLAARIVRQATGLEPLKALL